MAGKTGHARYVQGHDDPGIPYLNHTFVRRSKLVLPGVPNGMPATTDSKSPGCARSSLTAVRTAVSTISSISATSGECTACTPHTSPRRRAVSRLGVSASKDEGMRSRAARRHVAPDVVYVTAHGIFSACEVWRKARQM